MGAEYYLPLVFQSVLSPPAAPLRSGLLSLPFIFTEALSGVACGVYVHRFGRYASLTFVGALLMTLGYGLFISLSPSANLHLVIWSQLIAGFGSGLLLVPPLLALQASVDQDDNAAAAGAFSFVRNIAQAISVIFGALIFKHSMDAPAQQSKLRKLGIPANVLAKFQGREAAANVDALRHIADDQTRKTVQSVYYFSTRNMWIFYTGVTACCIVAAIIARKEISLDREFVETRTGITKRIANVADTELQQVAAMARQN